MPFATKAEAVEHLGRLYLPADTDTPVGASRPRLAPGGMTRVSLADLRAFVPAAMPFATKAEAVEHLGRLYLPADTDTPVGASRPRLAPGGMTRVSSADLRAFVLVAMAFSAKAEAVEHLRRLYLPADTDTPVGASRPSRNGIAAAHYINNSNSISWRSGME